MLISLNTVWVFLMEDYSRQWRNCEHRITVYLFISLLLLLLYWIVINLQHRHLSDQVEIGSFVGFNTSTLELFRKLTIYSFNLNRIKPSSKHTNKTKNKTMPKKMCVAVQWGNQTHELNAESLISVYYLAQKLTVHSVILQIDRNSYF